MPDEPENQTLAILRQIRTDIAELRNEMRDGFAKVEAHITATDDENAKVLDRILRQTGNLNEVWVDTQARVLNHEPRIKTLEEAQPTA